MRENADDQQRRDASIRCAGYPLFVDLRDRLVVVIGGGVVAERKIDTLLEYGAQVRVISPKATDRICDLALAGDVEWMRREYVRGDLAGAALGFCACGIPTIDEAASAEARESGCLLNVVDVPELCDFTVPSVMRRGLLSVAVSTSGASCTETANIRRRIEAEFDGSWEPYLDLMGEVRTLIQRDFPEGFCVRKPILQALASAGLRERMAAGEDITVESAYAEAVAASAAAVAAVRGEEGVA